MEQTRTVSWVYDQLSCVWSRGELLEKVKQDRKKRIERRAVLNSAVNEKGISENNQSFIFVLLGFFLCVREFAKFGMCTCV